MAIERNAASEGGNYIKDPGEYRVKVIETKTGMSKSGKPMLTVKFQASDEREIAGYFVKTLKFHMKSLETLKIACGLKITDSAENLVGRECGILVEAQEPTADGKVFMTIAGYGPAASVNPSAGGPSNHEHDEVPF
jgi:hypothetical protein